MSCLPHTLVSIRSKLALFSLIAGVVGVVPLQAAPTITDVSLRGLQIGGTTIVAIRGSELLPEPKLLLPVPLVRQQVRPGATKEFVEFEVEVSSQAVPGILPLRLYNAHGVSNSVAIGVDRLPEQLFAPEISSLPTALHGTLRGAEIVKTRFQGRRGMRISVDVEARRLGSQLRPVLRILDDQGRQLEWSQGSDHLVDDARFSVVLPADGPYQIQLHDLLYRGADPGFFRMKIGSFDFTDQVFPTGVQRGESASIQLLAHGKSTTLASVSSTGEELGDSLPVHSRSPSFTGVLPRLFLSDHLELVESAANTPLTISEIPSAVSGRLAEAGESDHYYLDVQPGDSLRLELYAQRLGSPLDGVLLVKNEEGNQLARGDDQADTSDPAVDLTVPEGTTRLKLVIEDLLGRGGEHSIYRLAVRRESEPRFSMSLNADRINVPVGSGALLTVTADRRGQEGPIELQVKGLPESVRVSGTRIPAGSNTALLALHGESPSLEISPLEIIGVATSGESSQTRIALAPELVESKKQPWLREQVPLAVTPPGPFTIVWQGKDESLIRGGELLVPLQITRSSDLTGKIRIRLLTSQPMPRKKIKEDNQEKEVDDIERALRLKEELVLEASQSEVAAHVLTPEDLPDVPWALVFVAELLSDDGETVIASAFTETQILSPVSPPSPPESDVAETSEAEASEAEPPSENDEENAQKDETVQPGS